VGTKINYHTVITTLREDVHARLLHEGDTLAPYLFEAEFSKELPLVDLLLERNIQRWLRESDVERNPVGLHLCELLRIEVDVLHLSVAFTTV